jgi:prepilin signal peptidase PulO-like enzyme (type II secretory pathway)
LAPSEGSVLIGSDAILTAQVLVLLGGFGVASYLDLKEREVKDELWLALAVLGGLLLLLETNLSDLPVVGLEVLAIFFVIQHFLPWDRALEDRPALILGLEATLYGVVLILTLYAALVLRPAPPAAYFALVAAVILARLLFESGLLYGGADAKALMATGVVLPIGPLPWAVALPATFTGSLLVDLPYALTILVDGAVLTLVVPLLLLAYNLSKGERDLARALLTYEIPTEELPKRFVWLKEPAPEEHPREETTAEDIALREQQARDLLAKGVTTVRVTPQLPFLVALAGGAVLGLLVGNLLFWVLSVL